MNDNNTEPLPKWIKDCKEGCKLTLRVTPRASRSEIVAAEESWLKVRLKAPPVDGKANKELINFVAKLLKVPKKAVGICAGESARLKRIRITGIKPEDFINKVL
ncbi:MAG: DUF167 domain-containing protein [Kiritimatiellae bacterium]|nr:DUF167 domain-containing protein [Kiritimatiellia bacterium]